MKKQWKRLLIAALSSSSVFAVTWYWYQATENRISSHGNEKPLAYVGKVVEDIQRRPASRLLWQLVNSGEPLYNGEAIRTSERGEVRIQFAGSDRYLDLEPESLIVIKKSEGEIALDLMEGSLFVNAKAGNDDPNGPALVLNSAKGKVDLSQVSASLSKGKGDTVDVQVLEGKASIKDSEGKSQDLKSTTQIRVLAPIPGKIIAMDAEAPTPIDFQWEGIPANARVSIWTGPTRKQLKELSVANTNQSQTKALLPFGRHYWKIVGTAADGTVIAESPVYRAEVLARYAPTVLFPTSDAEVPAEKTPLDVTFKWQKDEDARQTSLEVWKDADLKQKIATQSFASEDSFTVTGLKAGTYYWRIGSFYPNSEKPILGKIQKFTVTKPQEIRPQEAPLIPVQVNFTMPAAQMTQYYVDSPSVGLTWQADKAEQVTSWRVKVHDADENPANVKAIEVKEPTLKTPVTKPGRYIASIEALNKDGKVLGTSTSSPLTVSPLPLLKSPQFSPVDGTLQAQMDGTTELEWNQIDGVKEYWLVILKDGKQLKRLKYTKNKSVLKNLLPGEYEVEISAVDTYGRDSEPGTRRKLQVPDKSNLKAPTLKKIKVN